MSPEWLQLLQPPKNVRDHASIQQWFDRIAHRLLNGARLIVGGERHRLVEVEFYYYSDAHPDTFTHRDPIQRESGRWYFHRTGGVYRSGSFKGVDLTFGHDGSLAGILFRGLEAADGTLIDGPSLLVDRLLARSSKKDVATLDAAIAERQAWDTANPLMLSWLEEEEARLIYKCSRVGLSLKRVRKPAEALPYLVRPYRYMSEPVRTSKGKHYLILALHQHGLSVDDIRELTGSTKKSIQTLIADFEAGKKEKDLKPYTGVDLKPKDLARLHGIAAAAKKI
jgi:hypothetical protein